MLCGDEEESNTMRRRQITSLLLSAVLTMSALAMPFTQLPVYAAEAADDSVESAETSSNSGTNVSEAESVQAEEANKAEEMLPDADDKAEVEAQPEDIQSDVSAETSGTADEMANDTAKGVMANDTAEDEKVAEDAENESAGESAEGGDAAEAEESAMDPENKDASEAVESEEATAGETSAEIADTSIFTGVVSVMTEGQEVIPESIDGASSDDLFAEFVEKSFNGEPIRTPSLKKSKTRTVGSKLTGVDRVIYDTIAACLPQIAAGERASTVFEIPIEELGLSQTAWTAAELGVDSIWTLDENGNVALDENGYASISDEAANAAAAKADYNLKAILRALIADHPYHLYWYEKTQSTRSTGFSMSAGYDNAAGEYVLSLEGSLSFSFPVADEYAAGQYTVDTAIGKSVQTSVANANAIVSKYSSSSDYDKLLGYKNEICDLVSYNDEAAGGGVSFGNPWQMIWVFDEDPSTNVVCEGYSKAFKYLCDQTDFNLDINCITATGTMDGGTGEGAHMWNIVNMRDGQNYLVDVTNCDEGTIGASDELFMAGYYSGTVDSQYVFRCDHGQTSSDIIYVYNDETHSNYDIGSLTIADHKYSKDNADPCDAGHTWGTEYTVDQAATCLEEGSESIHCTVCGEIDESTVRAIPKADHAYGDWTVVKKATCTEAGSREKVCANCGDKITEETPATGHAYGDWIVVKEATEDEEGLERRTCSNDASHVEERTIPRLAHVHDLTKTEAKAATCTEDGNAEYWTCSKCGKIYSDAEGMTEISLEATVIHALGHTWGTEYTVDKEATCTEEGSESIHCSVCGESDPTTARAIPKTEHAYSAWTVVKEATCTEAGSREKVCANCGDKITEETPATGHAYSAWTVVKEATCTEAGSREKVCTNCGDKITEEIPATGHAYGDWTVVKEPTCTEVGSREKVCANCGDKITEEIPATGHAWSKWVVVKEATENEEGLERRTCSNDTSHVEERAIPKLSHVHDLTKTDAKAATCTEAGNIEYWTCTKCGRVYSDAEGVNEVNSEETVIHALGHSWSTEYTVDKEATCTAEGIESIHCTVCGESDPSTARAIPKAEHAYGDWTVAKKATCTESGSREKVCANCGDKITEEIPATGHAYGDWTVVKEATCTEAGSREKVCANCGDKIAEVIPATGHQWNEEYTADQEATCTAEGIESIHCSVCGESDPTTARAIPKAEHAYGDWTVVKKATCTETGSREKVCANCGDKIEEEIPAAHQWNENYTVDVAPTYTEEGVESIHCSVCGEIKAGSERAIAKLKKIPNTITAKNITRTYSTKAQYFGLGVKVKYGTPTYKSSTKSVSVSKAGRVTVKAKFIGRATITITSPKSTKYTAATKKITITVNPTKTTLSSVTSPSKGKMTVKWKKNAVGTGYLFQYSTSSKFTKPKTVTIKKNTILSKTIGSLVRGKKYYVRIRTYKTVGGVKFYSGWSAVKAVTVKK